MEHHRPNSGKETGLEAVTILGAGPCAHRFGSLQSFEFLNQIDKAKKDVGMLKNPQDFARQYIDIAGVMILVLDITGNIRLINKKGCQILGRDEHELISKNWFDTCLPQDSREKIKQVFKEVIKRELISSEYVEGEIVTKSGKIRTIAWHNTVITDEKGNITGTLSSGEDITDKIEQQQNILLVNRLYATLSGINESIARKHEKNELLKDICDITVNIGQFNLAWIGMFNSEGIREPVCYSGQDHGFIEIMSKYLKQNKHSELNNAHSELNKGKLYIIGDINNMSDTIPWKKEVISRGYNSVAILPITGDGKLIGTFAIYSDKPNFFIEEKNLLEKISSNISFALEKLEIEDRNRVQEKKLKLLNRIYAFLSKINQMITTVKTRDEFFQEICKIAVTEGGFPLAWVGIHNDENKPSIVTSYGLDNGYAEKLCQYIDEGSNDHVEKCLAKLMKGKSIYIDHLQENSISKRLIDDIKGRNLQSAIIIPLRFRDSTIGNFTIYNNQSGFFDEEKELFDDIAKDISIALEKIDLESERTKSRLELLSISRFPDENPNPVMRISNDGILLYKNSTAMQQLAGKIVGEQASKFLTGLLKQSQKVKETFKVEHERHGQIWELTVVPIKKENYINIYFQNITQRKQYEQTIKRNESRLESLFKIWEYKDKSNQDLLDKTLSEAIHLTESKIGYLYFYDETKHEFTLNTWSKETMHLCSITNPQRKYQLENTGIWGEAVRQRKPIIINNYIAPDPLKRGYPSGHAELLKFMTIPVMQSQKIVAVIGVANKETDYDQSDVKQLTLLMDSVWNIMNQRISEQKTRESEKKYRSLFEASIDPIVITSFDGKVIDYNKSAETFLGYCPEEIQNISVKDMYLNPDDRFSILKEIKEKGFVKDFYTKFIQKNGQIKEGTITADIWEGSGENNKKIRSIVHDMSENIALNKKLEIVNRDLTEALEGSIQALSTMSEFRDSYTAGHQKRVAKLSREIAKQMRLPEDIINGVYFAGLLHDIGKISIPAELLSKPSRLTEVEKLFIQSHPLIGYEILKNIKFPWNICEAIFQHHERLDGSGYPNHLKGKKIAVESRILAVADVVEAMSSHRPYRPSLGIEYAMAEIRQYSGIYYDKTVVKACLEICSNGAFMVNTQS